MRTYVCIGNGVRADGTPGAIDEAIIDTVMNDLPASKSEHQPIVIFSGGYRNSRGVIEAHAMISYALHRYPVSEQHFSGDYDSYRTHNNAVEVMKIIARRGVLGGVITVCDHPLHLPRTLLAFQVVNHIFYYYRGFRIVGLASEEVYDAKIPGQPQWANRESFAAHERKAMILYRLLLLRPWARFGLWLLRRIWPSHKQ